MENLLIYPPFLYCEFAGETGRNYLLICFHFTGLLLLAGGYSVTEVLCTVEIPTRVNHSLAYTSDFVVFFSQNGTVKYFKCSV